MQNKVPKLQNKNSFGSVITPLFLPSNGYRHHPLEVKSHHAPRTEDIMPKLSHTPHRSGELLATYVRLGCGVGERGKGDPTHANKLAGGVLCWVTAVGVTPLYMLHEAEALGTITYKYTVQPP